VGSRRPSSRPRRGDSVHEDALRAVLLENPNDARAFSALAEIVRRRAAETKPDADPLAADPEHSAELVAETREREARLAVWSLAEELAGNPKAWYPLVELARPSLDDDPEGAMRRLTTAADRDPAGTGLASGLELLRGADRPGEALGLGVGHWRPREHVVEAGRQIVLAALDADRPIEARAQLDILVSHSHDARGLAEATPDLERRIAEAEQRAKGSARGV
jgi:hypothetical protein